MWNIRRHLVFKILFISPLYPIYLNLTNITIMMLRVWYLGGISIVRPTRLIAARVSRETSGMWISIRALTRFISALCRVRIRRVKRYLLYRESPARVRDKEGEICWRWREEGQGEREKRCVAGVVFGARVLSQWERIPMMMTKVTSVRRMALRV